MIKGHAGCSANEERSNLSTGKAKCRGAVTARPYRAPVDGWPHVWLCDHHYDARKEDQQREFELDGYTSEYDLL